MRSAVPGCGRRILVFTIPNEGHLNVLRRLVREYRAEYEFRFVLVDRNNTPPDLGDLGATVIAPEAAAAFTNTAAGRVFARVRDVLDECLAAARAFRPDLILYDFCAIEGYFVGRVLGIPSWCSVPGLMGPLVEHGYLARSVSTPDNRAALAAIARRYGVAVRPDQVELISNSLFLPGDLNLLWSYPAVTPPDFLANRHPARYRFAGYPSDGHPVRQDRSGPALVYLSFGTEVMDNLWCAQEETRRGIRRCVAGLARRWAAPEVAVVFATQGRPVLPRYPANWRVVAKVDQQRVLSEADVFVTHGGSNSLHEAILYRVPMVVVPFFGDQMLIGPRVEQLGIGVVLPMTGGVDKDKPERFLDDRLAERMDAAVRRVLADERYRRGYAALPLESTPALAEPVPVPDG
ncbi:glycosyltransferase [Rhizomonospora bruguierae]|uniref:glycosyltransferase n=1 Tax=Rhizomonospora bruguierae TaxID=1581705 RepID=UPI001BCE9B0E|nr:glycosyltransferase [Micromonospora sp. NBRC 107566]